MNELSNAIPKDGRSLSELLESSELDPKQWRVRRVGSTMVLEPIGEAAAIPPGSYTTETLPLSEKARAILASVDAALARMEAGDSAKASEPGDGTFTLDDDAAPGFQLSDDALPGLDPDRQV